MDHTEAIEYARFYLKALSEKVDITNALYKILIEFDGKVNDEMKCLLHGVRSDMIDMKSFDRTNVIDLVIKSFDAIQDCNYSNVRGNIHIMIGSGRVVIHVYEINENHDELLNLIIFI